VSETKNIESKSEVTPNSQVVDQGEPVDIQAMGKFFEGIVSPLARS
tara:strand:+ start:34661 stop:34798 length:138 start_codon:yes stop_codon:yes gene_type:complete